MVSVSTARRVSAIVGLVAPVALLAVTVLALVEHLLVLLVAMLGLGVAIGVAAYGVTRTGARRLVATVVAVAALVVSIVLVVAFGQLLLLLLLMIALVAIAGVATRYALGRDIRSLKSGPSPGMVVGPAVRPVLPMNPKSGGGKVERFGLVAETRRRSCCSPVMTWSPWPSRLWPVGLM